MWTGHRLSTGKRRRAGALILSMALIATGLAVTRSADALPGVLDPTYGTDGVATLPEIEGGMVTFQVAVTPSGAVWALEFGLGPSPQPVRLTRVAPDGDSAQAMSLDQFVGPAPMIVDLVADGERAVVATGNSAAAVLRVLPDMTLDPGFASDGVVDMSLNEVGLPALPDCSSNCVGYPLGSVARDAAGGFLVPIITSTPEVGIEQALMRLDNTGALDLGYGDGGLTKGDLFSPGGGGGMGGFSGHIVVDGQGRSIVSGTDKVVRVLPGGGLDSSFGTNGVLSLDATLGAEWGCGSGGLSVCPAVVGPGGSILVSGDALSEGDSYATPGIAEISPNGSAVVFRALCIPDPPNPPPLGCGASQSLFMTGSGPDALLHLVGANTLLSVPLPLSDAPLLGGVASPLPSFLSLTAAPSSDPDVVFVAGAGFTPTGLASSVAKVRLDSEPLPLSGSVSPPSGEFTVSAEVPVAYSCTGAASCSAVVVDGEVPDPAPTGQIDQWDPPVAYAPIAAGDLLDTSAASVKTVLVFATAAGSTEPLVVARARYEIIEGGDPTEPEPPAPTVPEPPAPPTPPACPSSRVVAAPQGITDLREGAYESDSCIFVVAETSGIVLDGSGLSVKAPVPNRNLANPAAAATTLRNRTVESYLLHADRKTATGASTVSGTYTFPKPILGVVPASARLDETDALVSLVGTQYNAGFPNRGLEIGGQQTVDDSVRVSGRTLNVTFQFSGQTDELRVITGDLGFGGIEQSIDFAALPANPTVGSTANLSASATSGLAVGFAASGGCTVTGSKVTFTGVAPCTVTAYQNGDANWAAAPPVERSTTAARAAQTINFTLPATAPAVGTPFNVSATASSKLPVTFTATGPCTSSGPGGATITMTGPGSCSVTAGQAGNDDYQPASSVTRTTVAKGDQTVAFPELPTAPAAGTSVTLGATATSGLSVSYVASGGCRLGSGNRLTFTRATTCEVAASQAGNSNWNPAPPVIRTTDAVRGDQTITFTMSTTPRRTGSTFTVSATATSGLAVSFSASGACESSGPRGATITVISSGTCTVTAAQAGNDDYRAAADVIRAVSTRADQGVTFPALPTDPEVGSTVTLSATASSGLNVTYAAAGGCTVSSGRVTFIGVTECRITAFQAGNSTWNPAAPVTRSTTAAQGDQTITFALPSTARSVGSRFTVSATATSRLAVTFTATGACASSGPRGSTITVIGAGSCSVTASQTGNANWRPAPDVTRTIGQPAPQTITFADLPIDPVVGTTVTLAATSSSGLAVSYRAAGGGCTIASNRLTFTHAAACNVTASQAGNSSYLPASPVTRSTTVAPGDQTISFALPSTGRDGWSFAMAATASSRLPVTYTATGACVTSGTYGGQLLLTGAGSCEVTASQAGNADYRAADSVTRVLTVTSPDPVKADQTISFAALPSDPAVGSSHLLVATASSGLTVTYAADGGCRVSASRVYFTGVGVCSVTASQAGNSAWNAATPVTRATTVVRGDQSISFTLPVPLPPVGTSFTVSATASSALAVSFTATGACAHSGADGSTITMTATGTCIVTAAQAGNADYRPAPNVVRSATLRADQTVTFGDLPIAPKVGDVHPLTATATSGLAVTFSAGGGCALVGSTTLRFTGVGECNVTASQGGNGTWNPAPPVTRTTNAATGTQSITFALPMALPAVGDSFTATATATSGLAVTFTATGACAASGPNGATISMTAAGTCSVTAAQAGDADWQPATPVTRSAVLKADQTITFPNNQITPTTSIAPDTFTVGRSFALRATATSGLTVTFTASGGCTITPPATVVFTAVGECMVTADQAGNGTWNPAPSVTQTYDVQKGNQTISLAVPDPLPAVGGQFTVTATASSALPVTIAATGACTNTGGNPLITVTAAGVCTITATQPGNTNWNAAAAVEVPRGVKANQTITFPALPTNPKVGDSHVLGTTATSGLTVTYTAAGGCAITTGPPVSVKFTGAGTCSVTARQDGNGVYNAAPPINSTTFAAKGTHALTWVTPPPAIAAVGSQFTVAATSSVSGVFIDLTVTTGGATGGACTTNFLGDGKVLLTFVAAGYCSVSANSSGNADYEPATLGPLSTTVKATPTITFTAPTSPVKLGSLMTVTATTTGGGTPILTASGACTADTGQYLVDALGICTITATVPGDSSFSPATQTIQIPVRMPEVATLAGSPDAVGSSNGAGAAARFAMSNGSSGLVADAAGSVFVADEINRVIRQVSPTGVVTTYAGTGARGRSDGGRTTASFSYPKGVDLDDSGNLWVGEYCAIRKIATGTGNVTTHVSAKIDGGVCRIVDGPRANAGFGDIWGVAASPDGSLHVATGEHCTVRKVTASVVSTFVGSDRECGLVDGAGSSARLRYPTDIERNPRTGQIHVADKGGVSSLSASGDARRSIPIPVSSIAADANGNLFLGAWGRIGFLSRNGKLSWLNDSEVQFADGPISFAAGFDIDGSRHGSHIAGIDVGPDGDLYLTNLQTVRRVTL